MARSNSNQVQYWFAVAAISTILIGGTAAADAQVKYGEVQQGGGGTRCCMNNFRFAGTCEVTVGSGESCHDVLSYLNNFQSVGGMYCGGTLVRGGWSQVQCQEASSTGAVSSGSMVTAPSAQRPQTVQLAPTTGAVGTTGQTFVTPVDASTAKVQEPGIINF